VCKCSGGVETSKSFEGFETKKLRKASILIRTIGLIVEEFVETKQRSRPLKDWNSSKGRMKVHKSSGGETLAVRSIGRKDLDHQRFTSKRILGQSYRRRRPTIVESHSEISSVIESGGVAQRLALGGGAHEENRYDSLDLRQIPDNHQICGGCTKVKSSWTRGEVQTIDRVIGVSAIGKSRFSRS
jgi:hypothetical protein